MMSLPIEACHAKNKSLHSTVRIALFDGNVFDGASNTAREARALP
jgi:hypothetical protein